MTLYANSRIYVAGHRGMVGSAIVRALDKDDEELNVFISEHDLRDGKRTLEFFLENRPTHVFLAAAKVGGIDANRKQPVEFLLNNLQIQNSVIRAAASADVQKLLFLGSSCIYPRDCPQPIKEEYLLTGPLEPTNESYALAKIAGLKLCQAYQRQHGFGFFSVMPTNLYGPGDHYNEGCHVIPALINRFHKEKDTDGPVPVWGHPDTRREFLYVDDLAEACIRLMTSPLTTYSDAPWINIGFGSDISIQELALAVCEEVKLDPYRIRWDDSMPAGTPRKWLDSSRITAMGWKPKTSLATGLHLAYADYLSRLCS